MKKRIIAILLSVSVFFCSFGIGNRRASAAIPGLGAIQIIGSLAWQIIGVCTGKYDSAADAISYIIKGAETFVWNGWDGLTNPDSPFQQMWSPGFVLICDTIQGWVNSGDVKIEDGNIKLTYEQYKDLYSQLWNYADKPEVKFESDYNYLFFKMDNQMGSLYFYPCSALPRIPSFLETPAGQSYTMIFYDDNKVVFPLYYFFVSSYPSSDGRFDTYYSFRSLRHTSFAWDGYQPMVSSGGDLDYAYSFCNPEFYFRSPSSANIKTKQGQNETEYNYDFTECFVFTDGALSRQPISEVDLSDCLQGMMSTTGDYPAFLKSIWDFSVASSLSTPLDDLSGTIPTEYNPSLSFPVSPDLSRPLENQIIVGDVPGAADLPLSDYQAKLNTDIEVPSIIASKFPFCIPFDFIRFLGLLCSDPVAPVFRIPISTNPGNLDQWIGNETVGEYLSPSEPMFEIDEEIVIDLSAVPLVQPVCYTCFIVGFIILLLHITPKMIQH